MNWLLVVIISASLSSESAPDKPIADTKVLLPIGAYSNVQACRVAKVKSVLQFPKNTFICITSDTGLDL